MDRLKSSIPEHLTQMVRNGDVQSLKMTSSHLLTFFQSLPVFDSMINELSRKDLCAKNKEEALILKRKGNISFSSGDYESAMSLYSKALRLAPMDAMEMGKSVIAMIYLNRAILFHKLSLLKECLLDCNNALQISPSYAKAWYRRGKANFSLGNLSDAISDFNVAKEIEISENGKRDIEKELQVVESQKNKEIAKTVTVTNEKSVGLLDETVCGKMVNIITHNKGRCAVASCEIRSSSLIHVEEPYAAVILKKCRESHCHYCFCELPLNTIPCASCSVALYCSQLCRGRAGDKQHCKAEEIDCNSLKHLNHYVAEVTSCHSTDPMIGLFHDHTHECSGVSWPWVFPPDVVLGGRIIAKSATRKNKSEVPCFLETEKLSHNYTHLTPEDKLDLHVYSIALLRSMQHSGVLLPPITGFFLSQVIILISQIRINCMAIVKMKSLDSDSHPSQLTKSSLASTLTVTQIPVAQALYITGSLFNHSCQPNIHAYFLSRKLYVRTTELILADSHLELSYGPQVGGMDCKARAEILADKYSFICQCSGCSRLNLSDCVINAFRCISTHCTGVVLDQNSDYLQHRLAYCSNSDYSQRISSFPEIMRINNFSGQLHAGSCLNCGRILDLERSRDALKKSWIFIERLSNALHSNEIENSILDAASEALNVLKQTLHRHNKRIAQALDVMAEAKSVTGDLKAAADLCCESIRIIEILYGSSHIAIGHELVKQTTIQLALGDVCVPTIKRCIETYKRYYGSHFSLIFPQLKGFVELL